VTVIPCDSVKFENAVRFSSGVHNKPLSVVRADKKLTAVELEVGDFGDVPMLAVAGSCLSDLT